MNLMDKNLYLVGGVVRDEILGVESFDTDYCYEGNAIEFAQGLNIIKTNPDFGTVRVKIMDEEIDIASTRIETYPKAGHLPIITAIGCSLKEDLIRRDFTINAMAKNTLTNEIFDYYNGKEDIKNKKLRVLHNNSFIDDPTRIIRGLKFAVRFGFTLENDTKILQDKYLENINYDMSFHRLKKELKETFNLKNNAAYEIFVEQNIYKLLGENQPSKGFLLKNIPLNNNVKEPWLNYLAPFNLENISLSKAEQNELMSYRSCRNL
ncbi:MAG: hypothetical protein MJ231_07130 [bacterium]|nr:hypothetical protein [bacterium]